MATKRISQREARQWKARARYAEYLIDAVAVTPGKRIEVAHFTLDATMLAKLEGATTFGARCRVERFGGTFRVYAFRDEDAPGGPDAP